MKSVSRKSNLNGVRDVDYRRTSSKADLYDETNFFLFILSAVNTLLLSINRGCT